MKKILLLLITILLLASFVSAASVTRNMPSRIAPGSELKVTFYTSNAHIGEVFSLEDAIPAQFVIKKHDVTGYTGAVDTRTKSNRYGWSFEANSTSPTITYYIDIPAAASGVYTFDAVWFDSDGQNRNTKTLTVAAVQCGDGYCDAGETEANCVADCKKTAASPLTGATTAETNKVTGAATAIPPKPGRTVIGNYYVSNYLIALIILAVLAVIGVIIFKAKKKKRKHAK